MKTAFIWCGNGYPNPQAWARKSDMPTHIRHQATGAHFRFCSAYVALDENRCVLMVDGQRMPIIQIFTPGGTKLMGPRDLNAADSMHAEAWRNALSARIEEECSVK